jgi:hypothetical protein
LAIEKLVVVCEDCGDPRRIDKTSSAHRLGRCGVSKEKIAETTNKVAERYKAFGESESEDDWVGNELPCLGCGDSISIEDEKYVTCEGAIIWAGCDKCWNEDVVEACYATVRETWPEVIEAKKVQAAKAAEEAEQERLKKEKEKERFVFHPRSIYALANDQVNTEKGLRFEVPGAPQSPVQ